MFLSRVDKSIDRRCWAIRIPIHEYPNAIKNAGLQTLLAAFQILQHRCLKQESEVLEVKKSRERTLYARQPKNRATRFS